MRPVLYTVPQVASGRYDSGSDQISMPYGDPCMGYVNSEIEPPDRILDGSI